MGTRFSARFRSHLTGKNCLIEFIDSTYGGLVTELDLLNGPPVTLEYLDSTDERYVGLKGSRLSVNLMLENDAKGIALETWLLGVVSQEKEDQFQMAIYVESNLFWIGNVSQDQNVFKNRSKPYPFTITAVDGIARLKDLPFDFALTDSDATFSDLIWEILKKTPAYFASTQSNLFSICAAWYEDQMQTVTGATCPLRFSKVRNFSLSQTDKNDVRTPLTYYEALEAICQAWNLRVMFSNGLYKFIQVNNNADDGFTYHERIYSRTTGNYVTNNVLPAIVPIDAVNAFAAGGDGQWSFFPPIKRITLKYPFVRANMLNTNTNLPYTQTLRPNIVGGVGKRLEYQDYIRIGLVAQTVHVIVRVKLKIGGNYLKKGLVSNTLTWTTDSADRFETIYTLTPNIQGSVYVPVAFQTPDIPTGVHSANEFEVDVPTVVIVSTGSGVTPTIKVREGGNTSLIYAASSSSTGTGSDDFYEYIGQNSNAVINSEDINLPDAIFGEALDPSYPGNIEVWTGATWVLSTAQWKFRKTGTGYDFNEIRLIDILAGQTKPVRRFQTAFIGSNILPCSRISYGGFVYILNGAKYDFKNERWDGEWFAVSYARATYESIKNAVLQAGPGGQTEFYRIVNNLGSTVEINTSQIQAMFKNRLLGVTSSAIAAGVSVDTINVNGLDNSNIKVGDRLEIISPLGVKNQICVADANADSGDITISIESIVFEYPIDAGAMITFAIDSPLMRGPRIVDIADSDPSIEGKIYKDAEGFLKVSAG